MRIFLKSRVEGIIQDCKLDCIGSLTIPKDIMKKNDILEHEQVHVLNKSNGRRFVTYAIQGDEFCLNGAATFQGNIGDKIIILTYELK